MSERLPHDDPPDDSRREDEAALDDEPDELDSERYDSLELGQLSESDESEGGYF